MVPAATTALRSGPRDAARGFHNRRQAGQYPPEAQGAPPAKVFTIRTPINESSGSIGHFSDRLKSGAEAKSIYNSVLFHYITLHYITSCYSILEYLVLSYDTIL